MKTFAAIVGLAAVAGLASADVLYTSSFESDGGGFTGDFDWERGIPTGWDGADYGGPEPTGGHTGDYVWGTVIGGMHSPSTTSTLTQTFDFTGFSGVNLTYFEWLDSGGNSFDKAQTFVNGDLLLLADGGPTGDWREVNLDLSAYDGMSSVTVSFIFTTTSVVERVGWYIDDVSLNGVPAPSSIALLGLSGLAVTRRRR